MNVFTLDECFHMNTPYETQKMNSFDFRSNGNEFEVKIPIDKRNWFLQSKFPASEDTHVCYCLEILHYQFLSRLGLTECYQCQHIRQCQCQCIS